MPKSNSGWKIEFAKLIDGENALIRTPGAIFVSSLKTGKTKFKIDRVNYGSKIKLYAERYLAIPTTGGAFVVDVMEGERLGKVPIPVNLTPEVAFSPAGERLALVAGNQFFIWDFKTAAVVHQFSIDRVSGHFYGWVDDDLLLTQLGGLISVELGISVWHYYLPYRDQTCSVLGGVATVQRAAGPATLVSLPLPHKAARESLKRISDPANGLMVVKSGTAVAIEFDGVMGHYRRELHKALKQRIEKLGWKVSDSSPIKLIAKIEQRSKETFYYHLHLVSPYGPPKRVDLKPFYASLELRQGEDLIWSRKPASMVPNMFELNKDESEEEAVKRYEQPLPEFFERIRLPSQILHPEVGKYVGRSSIRQGQWDK